MVLWTFFVSIVTNKKMIWQKSINFNIFRVFTLLVSGPRFLERLRAVEFEAPNLEILFGGNRTCSWLHFEKIGQQPENDLIHIF